MRFAMHYGFEMKFCNPNSGNEKGNVENKVGTLRRNLLVPEPIIKELNTLGTKLLEKCAIKNKQIHYKLKQPIDTLFEKEKKLMKAFNPIPFDTARYEKRKVNKFGLVEYSSCHYSASPSYVGEYIKLYY